MQARLDAASTGTALIAGLIVAGVGVGAVLPSLSSAVLAEVPRERSGMAGGALNTFRQLGFALGVAVFGTILAHRVSAGQGQPAAFADGLNVMLTVASAAALAAGLLVLIVLRGHGRAGAEAEHAGRYAIID